MQLLDRHRVTRLIELADKERRVTGPERALQEDDVAVFLKAAYDDASDVARAEFVARAKQMPTSAWPWSTVQSANRQLPLALVLLRGQVESADVDPGNRLPESSASLQTALDTWDTATIRSWITPQGWRAPAVRTLASAPPPSRGPRPTPPPGGGARPANGGSPLPPNGGVAPPGVGGNPPVDGGSPRPGRPPVDGGSAPPVDGGSAPPTTSEPPITPPPDASAAAITWRHPAVLAAGATMLTTLGVVYYSLGQSRDRDLPSPSPSPTEATKS